jgi:hypothetical protein
VRYSIAASPLGAGIEATFDLSNNAARVGLYGSTNRDKFDHVEASFSAFIFRYERLWLSEA